MKEPNNLIPIHEDRRVTEQRPEILPPARVSQILMPIDRESLGLLGYAAIFRRRKLALCLIALLGVAGSLAFTLLQRPVYRATASVEVESGNEDYLRNAVGGPSATPESTESSVQTEAALLDEDSLIEQAVAGLGLDRSADFIPPKNLLDKMLVRLGIERPSRDVPGVARVTAAVKDNMRVEVPRLGRVIRIHYDAHNPALAANIANKLADTLIQQKLQARLDTSQQVQQWLKPQLAELREKLNQSEVELQEYAQSQGLLYTGDHESTGEQNLRLVQGQLAEARADLIAKQAQYEAAIAGPPGAVASGIEDAVVKENQVKLTELRRQLAELSAVLKPENYKVARVQAQISALERTLQESYDRATKQLQQAYGAARAKEQMLSKAYADQVAVVTDQTAKGTRYDTLKREVEVNSQVYQAMMQKAKEAGIVSAVRPSNVRMVTVAKPPARPYKPSLPLNLGLGLFVGLTFGVAYLVAVAQADKTLRTPGEAARYLDVPELGAIPKDMRTPWKVLLGPNGNGHGTELVRWWDRSSAFSESFRAALTSLLFSGDQPNSPKIIAVTSPLPGEGKTTVASNLGAALSEIGHTVLLVDGDLRRPQLQRLFSLDNRRGLSDLLIEDQDLGESAAAQLIQSTEIPNLHILPSGPPVDRAAPLLHGPRLKQIFRRLQGKFDYLIVDVPPALLFADARIMARAADGVVLVLRAGQTNWPTAAAAAQRLRMDGVQILGTILNDWRPGSSGTENYGYGDVGKYYASR